MNEMEELKPSFDLQYRCRYHEVEHVCELQPNEVPAILERLASCQILDAHFHERIPICDRCGSSNLVARYTCTHCKSSGITKHKTIEHISCGYVDIEDHFVQKANDTICPRCNTILRSLAGPDTRVLEGWLFCKDCSKRSRDPLVMFACRECTNIMPLNDVSFMNLYSYTMNANVDMSSIILLEPVRKTMENLGYRAESPGICIGKSGVSHKFDIVCTKEDSTAVMDVIYSTIIVNESHVIKLFASAFDVGANYSIMIGVPGVTDTAEKLANHYGITLIQGNKMKDISEKLAEALLLKRRKVGKAA